MATLTGDASINPSNPCEYQLYRVLERANLLGYFNSFIQQGGDDVRQLCELSEQEFMEILNLVGMASKPLHIRRLQKSLQEWAKDNNTCTPFIQSQSSCQPQLSTIPSTLALACLQQQSHGAGLMGSQWLATQQVASTQWTSGQLCPSDSRYNPTSMPYTEQAMHQTAQVSQQASSSTATTNSSSSKTTKAESSNLATDACTLRHVAQHIMASHKPLPVNQTSHNKKLLQNVQHIIDMSADHPQRLLEIQKWAPIYGRFDSKRKDDKPLSAHELSVNEAAVQLCCLDPYLLVQRDKLFPLARQVVRESGYQFKHGHSRSIKVVEGKSDDVTEIKPKRLKLESRASSCREPDIVTPNPRTVQAEILKLRREERMNGIMLSLNSIVQKQSDVKASIAAAQSQDNIQEVYDLKVKLEKLTTQQLLLMTEQTDLIKRQRRSDRYYIAKARAEEENGDPTDIFNSHHDPTSAEETKLMIHPVHSDGRMQVQANSVLSAPPRVEDTRTEQGKGLVDTSDTSNTSNTSLAQTLLMQHTLMDEGLRVAQNYAISGKVKVEAVETQQIKSDSQDDVASRDAESTITALLSLSSNKDGTPENTDVTT